MTLPAIKNRGVSCGCRISEQKPGRSNGWSPSSARGEKSTDSVTVPCTRSVGVLRTVRMRLWTVGRRPLRREGPVQHRDGPGHPERHADARYRTGQSASPTCCPHL